ncbi:hypothetical protein ACKTEK_08165 [Tepidamorphus sp. 3E244]|uniref:hypothetical protein n=1 Tax=Tepidamorphus sp. 3E244 TaxID=3385498 RepID=UPI0038FCC855
MSSEEGDPKKSRAEHEISLSGNDAEDYEYISAILLELATIADKKPHVFLSYLIRMAADEAREAALKVASTRR